MRASCRSERPTGGGGLRTLRRVRLRRCMLTASEPLLPSEGEPGDNPMTQMHSPVDLTKLVQAILTRVRDREGYATKTKLVKYLYLIDLAAYRRLGRSLTGLTWVFHHYGPWTKEYEALYGEATRSGAIRVRPGTRPDLETEFVDSPERVDLGDVIADIVLEVETRHIVDTWADRRLGEMLDYVYFQTEPMDGAERGQPLDFHKVERQERPPPAWEPARGDRGATERVRRRIAEAVKRQPRVSPPPATPPRYDREYFDALQVLDEEATE